VPGHFAYVYIYCGVVFFVSNVLVTRVPNAIVLIITRSRPTKSAFANWTFFSLQTVGETFKMKCRIFPARHIVAVKCCHPRRSSALVAHDAERKCLTVLYTPMWRTTKKLCILKYQIMGGSPISHTNWLT
jgi:hypothetical protein